MPYTFLSRGLRLLGILLGVAAIAAAIWAYGVKQYDPATGQYFDGFGRELRAGALFGDRGPGLLWEIVDIVCGIVAVSLVVGIFELAHVLQARAYRPTRDAQSRLPVDPSGS